MIKNLKFALVGLLLISLVFFFFLYEERHIVEGRIFAEKALTSLEPGQSKPIHELYEGQWQRVCIAAALSTSGTMTSRVLKERLDIDQGINLVLPNGFSPTNEGSWAIYFFTPPNKVESLSISNRDVSGDIWQIHQSERYPPCLNRESAYVTLHNASHNRSVSNMMIFIDKLDY